MCLCVYFGVEMKRGKQITIRSEPESSGYEVLPYLKTSWTSCQTAEFAHLCAILKKVDSPGNIVCGFKKCFRTLKNDSGSIFTIVACVDGSDEGMISRLCFESEAAGVPVVLGRGFRELGAACGINGARVCCVALLRPITTIPDMLDFMIQMGKWTAVIQPAITDSKDLMDRFREVLANRGKQRPHTAAVHQPAKKPKLAPKPVVKKTATKQSFSTSLD